MPAGQDDDFAEFFVTNHRRTLAAVFLVVGDFAEAEDITQEAYVRAARHWTRVKDFDEPSLWVRRVAYNLAFSTLRRARRRLVQSLAQRSEEDEAMTLLHEPEVELDLHLALRGLPVRYRAVLTMFHLWQFSVEEIADELGLPPSTVRTQLVRGRQRLAAALQESSRPQLQDDGVSHGS